MTRQYICARSALSSAPSAILYRRAQKHAHCDLIHTLLESDSCNEMYCVYIAASALLGCITVEGLFLTYKESQAQW